MSVEAEAEKYWRNAEACILLAHRSLDEAARRQWRTLADEYAALALSVPRRRQAAGNAGTAGQS